MHFNPEAERPNSHLPREQGTRPHAQTEKNRSLAAQTLRRRCDETLSNFENGFGVALRVVQSPVACPHLTAKPTTSPARSFCIAESQNRKKPAPWFLSMSSASIHLRHWVDRSRPRPELAGNKFKFYFRDKFSSILMLQKCALMVYRG